MISKIIKCLTGLTAAAVLPLLAIVIYMQSTLPDEFYVAQGEEFQLTSSTIRLPLISTPASGALQAVAHEGGEKQYDVRINLMKIIPVKDVQVQTVPRKMVTPGGNPFGIKMFTEGVMIVGMSDIQSGSESINPSKEAGLKIGDLLLSINGQAVQHNEDVKRIIEASGGESVTITVRRDADNFNVSLTPVSTGYSNEYKAGIWVRDSSAGIGTMTYYDPVTLAFGGLGHAICDVDTGKVMPLSKGTIVDVNISGIHAGQSGKPGELQGSFSKSSILGKLYLNTEMGIFGVLDTPCTLSDPVPMALKQEVQPGPATIYSTISGSQPQSFDILIEKINYSDTSNTKNMVIRIIDPKLLATTGGIVQGMSGSPILQDGKLVGAVTHVFVNDPTRGYGIFAENMDKQLQIVESNRIAA